MLQIKPDEEDPSKTISRRSCNVVEPYMVMGEDVIELETETGYSLYYTRSTGALSDSMPDSDDNIPGLDDVG